MNDHTVLFETAGPVATITLNRPAQRNALDAATCAALREAVTRLEDDPALRVGILKGAGKVFCAGMDLRAFAHGEAEDILFGPGRFGGFVSRTRRKPVIASVHGAALAGGFELALAADLIVAAEGTILGLPEPRIGLVAGAGGAIRLGQNMPQKLATELLLTGGTISAARAAHFGLVNRVVPAEELTATAKHLAQKIAANAPRAVEESLTLSRATLSTQEADIWSENDRTLRDMLASDDAREGAEAFTEKRPPVWRGS